MCGIIGYLGKQKATPILITGLQRESYRGYDSSGLVVFEKDNKTVCLKAVGKIADLEKKLENIDLDGQIGLGHCLPPDTLIQLSDGRITEISKITERDRVAFLGPENLKFSDGEIKILKHKSPDYLYRIKTPSTLLETTSEHKMLVFADGKIQGKKTEDLSEGDLLIFPKRINIKGQKIQFREMELKRYYKATDLATDLIRDRIRESEMSLAEIAYNAGISEGYLGHITRNDRNFREDQLQGLLPSLSINFSPELFVPQNTIHGKFINLPKESSPDLMQIIGYFLGDGYAGERTLRFKDLDKSNLEVYSRLIKNIFNIEGRIVSQKGTKAFLLEINSFYLCNWLKVNVVLRKEDFLEELGQLPEEELASFLRGIFDAEGSAGVQAGQISLGMTNQKIVRRIQFLFLRFSILSSISISEKKEKNWNDSYRISLSNFDSIERFLKKIGFSSSRKRTKAEAVLEKFRPGNSLSFKILPFPKKAIYDRCLKFIKKSDLKKFLGSGGNLKNFISEATLVKFIKFLEGETNNNYEINKVVDEFKKFLEGEIVFQPILNKKKIKSPYPYLYDLQVMPQPNFVANCLLSHNCRWATHGGVTEANAHPHSDCKGNIWLVHNGIIENYSELKQQLQEEGHVFSSETDTEVVAHLVEKFFHKNLEEAVRKALRMVRGAYALAIIAKDDPGKIVVARLSSPLLIGIGGKKEYFVASDANAIAPYAKKVVNLDDNEIAVITPNDLMILREKQPEPLESESDDAQKKGFPHFMLKEIMEQPESIDNALKGRVLVNAGAVRLGGLESVKEKMREIERIDIVACGTAYHAGLVGEYMLEEYAGIPTDVDLASEFRYRKPIFDKKTAVLAISQSGETADTLAAIKESKRKGVLTLGVVNVVGSSVARETDAGVYNRAGVEIGVASTKAFTSQLAILALLTLHLGRQKELSVVMGQRIAKELQRLPGLIKTVLTLDPLIKKMAEKYKDYNNFFYLGRKYNYPIALEGALKLKEISYIHAEGYGAGELKHGPLALIDENFPTLVIAPTDSVYEKVVSNIEEIRARNGKIIVIASEGNEDVKKLADDVIYIPKTLEMLTPILSVIPLQLFAYHMGVLRGCDVDKPRNLAKSVTVE